MSWIYTTRLTMLKSIPGLWPTNKQILYVGANTLRKPQLVDELVEDGNVITLLEISAANAQFAEAKFTKRFVGDIRTHTFAPQSFDWAIWWHGPEHVEEDKVAQCLQSLEMCARECVLLSVPFGLSKQDACGPYELHYSTWHRDSFERFGYESVALGDENVSGSSIIAWKFLESAKVSG